VNAGAVSHDSETELDFEGAAPEIAAEAVDGVDAVLRAIADNGFPHDGRFALMRDAHLLRLAYANDKILSLSNSRTQILAHQVESTHRIVNALNRRFLLADEVGLGKTIEGGLVIKELIFRHGYRRILIVCPASLQVQWQSEMRTKFNEEFSIVDGARMRRCARDAAAGGPGPWSALEKAIVSVDFIKNRSFADSLKLNRWDAVIIDEAHRLRRDSLQTTQAYAVAEILSERTECLLLLTATPFRGKLEELYFLVRLIDKNLLGPFQSFYNAYCLGAADLAELREKIGTVLIRRTKKEIGGFTKRHARTIRFELYPEERALYDATTRYIVEEFNRAVQAENRAVGFVMTVFQKLLDSSSFALMCALRKRRAYLSALVEKGDPRELCAAFLRRPAPDAGEEGEEVRDDIFAAVLEKTVAEVRAEIATIDGLIALGAAVTRNKKGDKLRDMIKRSRMLRRNKVLIFTQFRTTQEYLRELLADSDVVVFHGSLSRDEKEEAIRDFRERADILVCTEAGGEGRNMQFCNILINYDLPWSPLKIEQRIGRIHRFGQKDDVYIFNFSTRDTVAERVLEVLTRKVKLFEESIGTPDVLLGEIEEELNLGRLFMELVSGRLTRRTVNREIDVRLEAARRGYEKLSELVVARTMDFNYDEYYRITLKERKFCNRRIEGFVNRAQALDARVREIIGAKGRLNRLYPVTVAGADGVPVRRMGTFDSARALANEEIEFLAFGNPAVGSIVDHCAGESFGGRSGTVVVEHRIPFIAFYANYAVTFRARSEFQELIPVCVDVFDLLARCDVDALARELLEAPVADARVPEKYRKYIDHMRAQAEELIDRANGRLRDLAGARAAEIRAGIGGTIDAEIEKIAGAHSRRIKELEEQLERQVGQEKWFDRDMKSAITRTKNKIAAERTEMHDELARYRAYGAVGFSARLINAGAVLSTAVR